MSDNSLKLPFAQSLVQAIRKGASNEIDKLGYALPCSVTEVNGALVRVNFLINGLQLPQVVMPIAESEYVRLPIQVGCLGFTVPADAYLGGVTGLGGGAANLWEPANLSNAVFVPVGSANWAPPIDGGKLQLYGSTGVIIEDKLNGGTVITISENGINIVVPAGKDVTINGIGFLSHVHSGVTTGSGDTGPPV